MLTVTVPGCEYYDESKNEFISVKPQTLQLEHSLVSLSKWESKWHKPFLSKEQKTNDEILDYIRCMTITSNVDPKTYLYIPSDVQQQIVNYIEDPMTATTIHENSNGSRSREIITSELIYYWMVASSIPFECQKWHLNRLLTLIKVCSIKNAPPKKMGKRDLMSRNASLNAARRAKLGSKG